MRAPIACCPEDETPSPRLDVLADQPARPLACVPCATLACPTRLTETSEGFLPGLCLAQRPRRACTVLAASNWATWSPSALGALISLHCSVGPPPPSVSCAHSIAGAQYMNERSWLLLHFRAESRNGLGYAPCPAARHISRPEGLAQNCKGQYETALVPTCGRENRFATPVRTTASA